MNPKFSFSPIGVQCSDSVFFHIMLEIFFEFTQAFTWYVLFTPKDTDARIVYVAGYQSMVEKFICEVCYRG